MSIEEVIKKYETYGIPIRVNPRLKKKWGQAIVRLQSGKVIYAEIHLSPYVYKLDAPQLVECIIVHELCHILASPYHDALHWKCMKKFGFDDVDCRVQLMKYEEDLLR